MGYDCLTNFDVIFKQMLVIIIASEAKRRRRRRLRKRKRANTQVILYPATTLLRLKYQFFENLPQRKKTFILGVESIFEVNRPGPDANAMLISR